MFRPANSGCGLDPGARPTPGRGPCTRREAAFTLIEILAVVLIMAFVTVVVIPGLRSTSNSARHDQALSVATYLELARQRAVMTGKEHRVFIDVDAGSYRVEWYVRQVGDDSEDSAAARSRIFFEGGDDVLLLAPPDQNFGYEPIPGKFGVDIVLDDPFYFDGIDTPEGWLDEGEVAIVFARDGTTDASQIVITDPDGFAATLDVLPLLETVRILHETSEDG